MNNWLWLLVAVVVVVALVLVFKGPACQSVDGNTICESVAHLPGVALGIPQGGMASPVIEYRDVEITTASPSPENVAFWYVANLPRNGAKLVKVKARNHQGFGGALLICYSQELRQFVKEIKKFFNLGEPNAVAQADGFTCLIFYGKAIQ